MKIIARVYLKRGAEFLLFSLENCGQGKVVSMKIVDESSSNKNYFSFKLDVSNPHDKNFNIKIRQLKANYRLFP